MDGNSWRLVSTYYQMQDKISQIRGADIEVCAICGNEICDHDPVLKQPREIVSEILQHFAESFLSLSRNCWFDIDRKIINWPDVGEYNYKIDYIQVPALNLPFSVIHKDNEGILAFTGGESNPDLVKYMKNSVVGDGTYFGYFTGDKFFLLRTFRNGKWIDLQRFIRMTSVDDVQIEDGLQVNGFWYIPKTADPYEFSKYLVYL